MFTLSSQNYNCYYDASQAWQLSFQDAGSPIMEEITFFHDEVMFILSVIITVVL